MAIWLLVKWNNLSSLFRMLLNHRSAIIAQIIQLLFGNV